METNTTPKELEELNPDNERTVHRNENEGLYIKVYNISPNAVSETRARTYSKEFGHYFINYDSQSRQYLGTILESISQDYNLVHTFGQRGSSYEMTAEVRRDIVETDVTLHGDYIEIMVSPNSEYAGKFEDLFATIEDEIVSRSL